MNIDAAAERLLDLARRRADHAEVFCVQSETHSVEFENNVLKAVSTSDDHGIGLRVIHEGRIGLSSTTDLAALDDVVDWALAAAAFGEEARFAFPATCAPAAVRVHDPEVVRFSMERAVAMGREAIDLLRAEAPDALCGAGVDCGERRRRLLNTSGLDLDLTSSIFDLGVNVLLADDDGLLEIDEGAVWRRPTTDLLHHARGVAEKLALARAIAPARAGKLPVLFTPRAAAMLLDTFAVNSNGKYLQKGISLLAGRVGERLLDEPISLWDDSLVDYAPGSIPADVEGIPCRRLPMFERGVFRNFIFDLQTAGIMGCEPTGSAVRSFAGHPGASHGNLRLDPGDATWEDMVRGMKRGIIIDQVIGAGQGNVLAGDFSVNLDLGYAVENGEIIGRVKDTMVSGNAFDAFNRILALGRDLEWHGSDELPAICFDGLAVTGA